jgi:hypothetical protein
MERKNIDVTMDANNQNPRDCVYEGPKTAFMIRRPTFLRSKSRCLKRERLGSIRNEAADSETWWKTAQTSNSIVENWNAQN